MKKDERIRFIIIAVGIALIYGWIKPFSFTAHFDQRDYLET